MTTLSDNNAPKIFKSRGLPRAVDIGSIWTRIFIKRLMTPETVETSTKLASPVESPKRVNNWRPRPPILLSLQNFLFIYCVINLVAVLNTRDKFSNCNKMKNEEEKIDNQQGNNVSPLVSRNFIGLFMHYDNGDMVNIQDLPKPEYEKFLEQMNALRMAYITLISRT